MSDYEPTKNHRDILILLENQFTLAVKSCVNKRVNDEEFYFASTDMCVPDKYAAHVYTESARFMIVYEAFMRMQMKHENVWSMIPISLDRQHAQMIRIFLTAYYHKTRNFIDYEGWAKLMKYDLNKLRVEIELDTKMVLTYRHN